MDNSLFLYWFTQLFLDQQTASFSWGRFLAFSMYASVIYDSVYIRAYVNWSSLKIIVERGEAIYLEILLFLAKAFWTWFWTYCSSEHSNECKLRPAIAGKINGREKSNKIGQARKIWDLFLRNV